MRDLAVAQDVRVEHVVAHVEIDGNKVHRQNPVTGAERHGKIVVTAEVHVADTAGQVPRAAQTTRSLSILMTASTSALRMETSKSPSEAPGM